VADRGLHAYVVPSTRAGQQTDPAARREALSGLMTGGFLMAVIAVVLVIIMAAPQYAEPATGAELIASESAEPSPVAEDDAAVFVAEVPTSKLPNKLRGYRWPVRGGMIAAYYDHDKRGDFSIDGVRVHDGLVITWFEGATVKAAHKGTVVAAGRAWARHVGFVDSLDKVYARHAKASGKKSKKPQFPQGVVIDDGNGYFSVYTELKDLRVKAGDVVKVGQVIGGMAKAEGRQMMRYRLVRMDGELMRVHDGARAKGYPRYARERVDPLAVLNTQAKRMPQLRRKPPANPPRLSEY
jgi:murein DD-endopeptidase MepM/ murein hydrolase activator NlpD